MKTAIIILTYNNLTNKFGSLESLLISLTMQNISVDEIVVIDNASDYMNVRWLKNLENRYSQVKFIYLNSNNIAHGRNMGIKNTISENIIFMDDDSILFKNNTLLKMKKYMNEGGYGYAANRLWTKQGWYEKNQNIFNQNLKDFKSDFFYSITSNPSPKSRNKKNTRHLLKTYIGNFGFIKREIMEYIGGWNENFSGYGAEDDLMAIELFLNFGRPILLNKIEIIHIYHKLHSKNYIELDKNKKILDDVLKYRGIKNFHVGRLMYNEKNIYELL